VRIRHVTNPVLQQPPIVIARHAVNAGLPQQSAAGFQAASAVGNVSGTYDCIHPLTVQPLQRLRQTLVLRVNVANYG